LPAESGPVFLKNSYRASILAVLLDSACNLSTSAMAAVPSMLRIEQLMQRFAFYIDSEQNKACNLHVAQRP
jgi:hypothetical protein